MTEDAKSAEVKPEIKSDESQQSSASPTVHPINSRQQKRRLMRLVALYGVNKIAPTASRDQRRLAARAYANAAWRKMNVLYATDKHKYDNFIINAEMVSGIVKLSKQIINESYKEPDGNSVPMRQVSE